LDIELRPQDLKVLLAAIIFDISAWV
jgi:hypothetical protein